MKYLFLFMLFSPLSGWSQSDSVLDTDVLNVDYIKEKEEGMLMGPFEDSINKDTIEPYRFVEKMPEFHGGNQEMYKFLGNEMKIDSVTSYHGERIYIQFIVDAEGKIGEVVVINTDDEYLKKELISIIKRMPVWKPGVQKGEKVAVKYTLPVHIHLD